MIWNNNVESAKSDILNLDFGSLTIVLPCGQPMHSQLALTDHASLNLAPLILLDPVILSVMDFMEMDSKTLKNFFFQNRPWNWAKIQLKLIF